MSEQTQEHAVSHAEEVMDVCFMTPAVDIHENEHELLLIADLPGVSKDKLTIHLDNRELTIQGLYNEQEGYKRLFKVGREIDGANIEASFQRGVLEVKLPKAPSLQPRQIPVHTA